MTAGKIRLKRKTAKDLWSVIGVVLVVTVILYSLPELDTDLSRADLIGVVVAGGVIFLLVRLLRPLFRRSGHRRRGTKQRSRRRTEEDASS